MGKVIRVKDLFKKIPNLEERTLLDVGTGPNLGYSDAYLHALSEIGKPPEDFRKKIYAVDIKKPDLPVDNMPETFVNADARNLPYRDESFDIIALGNLLHLFPDSEQEQIVKESYRVLRPEGYLIGKTKLPILRKARIRKYEAIIGKYFEFLENGTTSYVDSWMGRAFYFLAKKKQK